jgi:hypothetical protein
MLESNITVVNMFVYLMYENEQAALDGQLGLLSVMDLAYF